MVDVAGLVVVLALYIIVVAIGINAARRFKVKGDVTQTDLAVVAGRDLSTTVGVFTMSATVVGGGFINGTAESVATQGLIWTLAPFGIFVGLILGGLLFARPMRERRYLTMLAPFQERYGETVTGLLYIVSFAGDIFWSASILRALGTSLSIIIDMDVNLSIVISAGVALVYTAFGQMVSVAYTDIVQLILIVLGLVLVTPFAMSHAAVPSLSSTAERWLGEPFPSKLIGAYADLFIAMTLGSIPWQSYFQRVLSVRGARQAQYLSLVGGLSALILSVPPILIGAVGVSADWNQTELGTSPMNMNQSHLILPYTIHYLTPRAISVTGLGALIAAVMSSTDSAILGSSSMFTHNVYKPVFRKKASETELLWVQRASVLFVGTVAAVVAMATTSIYFLFIFAADIVFVMMLPQLVCVVHFKRTNSYGALTGYVLALILRIGAGELSLGLEPFIRYPGYNYQDGQLFPYRSFAFLMSIFCILGVSRLAENLFKSAVLPPSVDVFKQCGPNRLSKREVKKLNEIKEGHKLKSDVLDETDTYL